MTIFEKCGEYTEAKRAQARGVYPYYVEVEEAEPTRVRIDGRWKLMLGSNNYLGLTHDPRVLEAAADALERYGSGATGSRLLNGNLDLHARLEEELAAFLGTEGAVVFTTGYLANVGTLSALSGRSDHLFLDRLNHASLVDGARLGFGSVHRYRHADMESLARLLERAPADEGKLVVTDGVFSMDGEVADLPGLCDVAEAHGARVMVDDAHGFGVLGERGAGTVEHFGLSARVDLIMATFSKSLGSIGGVVAGPEDVIHFLKHQGRSLLFSASMPPASVAGALEALRIVRTEPERRQRLRRGASRLRDGLEDAGFRVGPPGTPVVPVHVGGYGRVLRFWRALFDEDIYVNAVVPPGVPENESRLRLSVTALHSDEELDRVVAVFDGVERALETKGAVSG